MWYNKIKKGIECLLTDSFESIEVVIQEAMSDLYENHNQSFDDLNMSDDIIGIFEDYKDDAIHYYDS